MQWYRSMRVKLLHPTQHFPYHVRPCALAFDGVSWRSTSPWQFSTPLPPWSWRPAPRRRSLHARWPTNACRWMTIRQPLIGQPSREKSSKLGFSKKNHGKSVTGMVWLVYVMVMWQDTNTFYQCLSYVWSTIDFSIAIGIFLARIRTLNPKVLLADEVDLYRLKKELVNDIII